jgi:exodeoxyribonuclease V alpha subunit
MRTTTHLPLVTPVYTRFRCSITEGGDFYFVDAVDPEEGVRNLLAIVQERIPKRFGLDPIRDIQCCVRCTAAASGQARSTSSCRKALNPPGEIRIDRFGWTFCPGDAP